VHVGFRRSQKVGLQNRRVLHKQTGKQDSKKLNPDRPRAPLGEIFKGRKLFSYAGADAGKWVYFVRISALLSMW